MSAGATGRRPYRPGDHVEGWVGGSRRYDIVKEGVIALVVTALLTIGLAVLFGSPDDRPVTLRSWSQAAPDDFVTAALSELAYTSEVAGYGPPYTSDSSAAQRIGPLCLPCIPGVRIPIDTARDFVIQPLLTEVVHQPAVSSAIKQYTSASADQQTAWTDAYAKALEGATFDNGTITLPAGDYGPVAAMMQEELRLAQSGGLDGALLQTKQLYQTDYTKPILFLSGGSYFEDQAAARHLLGGQWGMMNETGGWPGQPWLWLYSFWYQIKPFSDENTTLGANADAYIWAIMMVVALLMVILPFLPGVRRLPYHLKVYRLVWRGYYRSVEHPEA
jgi:hypothetical protein